MPLPPPETWVSDERERGGVHHAELIVHVFAGPLDPKPVQVRGPARRDRRAALKDCIELRRAAEKNKGDPSIEGILKRKLELQDTTWTEVHLGGRQLDGAETGVESSGPGARPRPPARGRVACRAGRAGANAASGRTSVELTDLEDAMPGATAERLKVAITKALKRFGSVMEVKLISGIASARFANAKSVEAAMVGSTQGFLKLGADSGGGELRIRWPGAEEAVWTRFPPARGSLPGEREPPKRKLRPNERFAARLPAQGEDTAPSLTPAPPEPPEFAGPVELPVVMEPDRPRPVELSSDASPEDRAVHEGEVKVAEEMVMLLAQPFSQQRKALKRLRLSWHPDKHPESEAVATRVFQFIQTHQAWLEHHGLS